MRISDWSSDVCSSDLSVRVMVRRRKASTARAKWANYSATRFWSLAESPSPYALRSFCPARRCRDDRQGRGGEHRRCERRGVEGGGEGGGGRRRQIGRAHV